MPSFLSNRVLSLSDQILSLKKLHWCSFLVEPMCLIKMTVRMEPKKTSGLLKSWWLVCQSYFFGCFISWQATSVYRGYFPAICGLCLQITLKLEKFRPFFNDFSDFYCFAVNICVRDVISAFNSIA